MPNWWITWTHELGYLVDWFSLKVLNLVRYTLSHTKKYWLLWNAFLFTMEVRNCSQKYKKIIQDDWHPSGHFEILYKFNKTLTPTWDQLKRSDDKVWLPDTGHIPGAKMSRLEYMMTNSHRQRPAQTLHIYMCVWNHSQIWSQGTWSHNDNNDIKSGKHRNVFSYNYRDENNVMKADLFQLQALKAVKVGGLTHPPTHTG